MSSETQFDLSAKSLAVRGELTIFSVQEIQQQLLHSLEVVDTLYVDLGEVAEIDTAGLQLMLLAKGMPGKTVAFANHSEAILRLIDLANLAHKLGATPNIQAKTI